MRLASRRDGDAVCTGWHSSVVLLACAFLLNSNLAFTDSQQNFCLKITSAPNSSLKADVKLLMTEATPSKPLHVEPQKTSCTTDCGGTVHAPRNDTHSYRHLLNSPPTNARTYVRTYIRWSKCPLACIVVLAVQAPSKGFQTVEVHVAELVHEVDGRIVKALGWLSHHRFPERLCANVDARTNRKRKLNQAQGDILRICMHVCWYVSRYVGGSIT